jgi:hypothetical protein
MAGWQHAALSVPNDPDYQGVAMPDNAIAALKALIEDERPIRILELGYGTGKSRQAIDEACGLRYTHVRSLEQSKKLFPADAVWTPTKRVFDTDMLCPVVSYESHPEGPWDMIVIDGPHNTATGPWVGGDIFHLKGDLKVGGVVFIQGRRLHVDYYQMNLFEEFIFERMWSPNLTVMRKR